MTSRGVKLDGTRLFSDTDPVIERKMIELIRTLTPAQKVAKISEMGRFMKGAALAAIRREHPDATEWECKMRVMSRCLPPDMMLKAFGWDVREKGY
jgi:hypothetical protein